MENNVFDFTDHQNCISVPSEFTSENKENDVDDPVSVYFRKRCRNSAKAFLNKYSETDDDSSVGVIDLDNISLFDEFDEAESDDIKLLRNSYPLLEKSDSSKKNGSSKHAEVSSKLSLDPKSLLDKQRALAQKALMKVFNQNNDAQNETSNFESTKNNHVLVDVSHKLNTDKISSKDSEKKWVNPNFSPDTPRCFNDELNSFSTNDFLITNQNKNTDFFETASHIDNIRQSQYKKKLNSLINDFNKYSINSDLEFECQTKEDKINRLEEDERQFKLENSALLHNSNISQFSGIVDVSHWPFGDLNSKEEQINKLSIGEFFNKRSDRISSLLGSSKINDTYKQFHLTSVDETENIVKPESKILCSNIKRSDKIMPRRCFSTYDTKSASESFKANRISSDSNASNSTLFIQNILAEMEPGLSGTQVYEILIKNYGTKKIAEKENNNKPCTKQLQENIETPKSSKNQKKNENCKLPLNDEFNSNPKKEHKNFNVLLDTSKSSNSQNNNIDSSRPIYLQSDLNVDQSISILRNEKIKGLKGKKGFDASTPKMKHLKSHDEKFQTACNEVKMQENDWEAPKVSFIQPTVDFKSEDVDENEKTLTINLNSISSSESNRKNSTIIINDNDAIEGTIIAGDLTILSKRIEEMKEDGVCIVRSEEPVLLSVVQKLADLPKGSIDCSALTPLLRDQFPELLSAYSTPPSEHNSIIYSLEKSEDSLFSEPNSWVKFPNQMGYKKKIYAFVEVKKEIFVPLLNVSKNWLLVSISSVTLLGSNGHTFNGVRKNGIWNTYDFAFLSVKDTVIPPGSKQSIQISFTPHIPAKIDLQVTFIFKQIFGKSVQTRNLELRINSVNPVNSLNIIPKDMINFGHIADQCFDQRTIQITFDGISELPLLIFIQEHDMQNPQFFLKFTVNSSKNNNVQEMTNHKFSFFFKKGEKQHLDFKVVFQPNVHLNIKDKKRDFNANLIIQLGTDTESDGVLETIPIKGSVSLAKFFMASSCSPFVFKLPERGQSLTRLFPLKNVGQLPITFSIKVQNGDTKKEENDDIFVTPKSFYLPLNEESAMSVTFNSKIKENSIRRLLILKLKPNGRVYYEIELIGLISSMINRSVSGMSNCSELTKSFSNTESVPIKLLTTMQSLSWPSLLLENETRQTFYLKNASGITVKARITLRNDLESFKLINENGEKVRKMLKILKPNIPYLLTVSFRPDFIGPHHNGLLIQTNQISGIKVILLNGMGGLPNLFISNIKSDLNGSKMIVLQNSLNTQFFNKTLEIKNTGRIPGFIFIKTSTEILSLGHKLSVTPTSYVLHPDSKVTVDIAQKLKNEDIRLLLSDKDICKIATLLIVMGDEVSRLRMRKLIKSGKVAANDHTKMLTSPFENEKEINLKNFDDPKSFEYLFLKSLRVLEAAVVIEKSSEVMEPTIVLEEDETITDFVTICCVADSNVPSTIILDNSEESETEMERLKSDNLNNTVRSLHSKNFHKKIHDWLETLE